MIREPFEYDRIFYNEVISYLETKWRRQLTEHERNTVIEGYRFGRLVEADTNSTEIERLKEIALEILNDYDKAERRCIDEVSTNRGFDLRIQEAVIRSYRNEIDGVDEDGNEKA